MYSKEEKEQISSVIILRIEDTEREIKRLTGLLEPLNISKAIGRKQKSEIMDKRKDFETGLEEAREKLKSLKKSLKDLEKDEYGHCESCNHVLPIGAILMIPERRTCPDCLENKKDSGLKKKK